MLSGDILSAFASSFNFIKSSVNSIKFNILILKNVLISTQVVTFHKKERLFRV